MYESLGRRANSQSLVGRDARQELRSVFFHTGDADDFLRRHREICSGLPSMTRAERQEVADQLLRVAADFRSAKTAWARTANDPRAAGPDGIRQEDLPGHVQHQLFRMLGDLIEPGHYQAGKTRRVNIPKSNGKPRPIDIANLADSLASRMLAQAITPFLDLGLTPWCVGGRENHGREMALVWAMITAEKGNRWVWIAQDVRDAFPSIPRPRLRQVLLSKQLSDTTVEQIEKLIGPGAKGRGIPQGNPLSPLLLNVYLDQCLDRPWLRAHRDTPIIRYVDDVLLMLGETSDPEDCHRELDRTVQSAGMRLKHPMDKATRDLSEGEAVDWIGYRVSRTNGTWLVEVGESSWDRLALRLQDCHMADHPPRAAESVLQGWVSQQGACYHPDTVDASVTKVVQAARAAAFGEIAVPTALLGLWERAHARYQAKAAVYRTCLPVYCAHDEGSSADRHITAIRGRRGGAGNRPVPPPFYSNSVDYQIWTDGSKLERPDKQLIGGWAFVILNRFKRIVAQISGCVERTTNNRMELMAVIRALESLEPETRAEVYTDSQYVIHCAYHAREWHRNKWHKKSSGLVKNHDLIGQLLDLCQSRYIQFKKVKGHSGDPLNELVDQEANRQALNGTPTE